MSDPFEFLARLRPEAPLHLLVVGGLPRSGTSSCDRFLHAHTGCFMTDEHHGLLNDRFLSAHEFLIDYQNSEIDVWRSDSGRSWRDFTLPELDWARRRELLSLLFLYTRPSKFIGKTPEELGVIGIKLPHIENTLLRMKALVAPCPVTFIYCVREPIRVLTSNWEMPWVSTIDSQQFANGMLPQYADSLAAFRAITEAKVRTVVWRTPDSADNGNLRQDFIDELDLGGAMGCYQASATQVVDEWPPERRRQAPPIGDEVIRAFSSADAVREFRRVFQLPEPCL